MKTDVIILAGGLGTRLQSVVSDVPKCMAPIAGEPFLKYMLKWLERFSTGRVILSLGHLSHVVTGWVDENRSRFPFDITWVIEDTPLGTGGGMRLALSKVQSGNCVILNGDTFFDVDIDAFTSAHMESGCPLSIALKPMTDFSRYGTVSCNAEGRIISFNEKRYCSSGLINGGVYCLSSGSGLMDGMPERFSFEKEILEPQALAGTINGYRCDGTFIDIGIPQDYSLAQQVLPANIRL